MAVTSTAFGWSVIGRTPRVHMDEAQQEKVSGRKWREGSARYGRSVFDFFALLFSHPLFLYAFGFPPRSPRFNGRKEFRLWGSAPSNRRPLRLAFNVFISLKRNLDETIWEKVEVAARVSPTDMIFLWSFGMLPVYNMSC